MKYDPQIHHRHSIRLAGYDYSQAGAYFVTVVTQNRACRFGKIINGEMRLNPAGEMIEKWWLELENKFPTVELGTHAVMPNHFHGIICIAPPPVRADLRVGPPPGGPPPGGHESGPPSGGRESGPPSGGHTGPPLPAPTLPTIIQWYKTMTTNEYIRGVKQSGWPPFDGKLWQRNYYEHIIRNDGEYQRIHLYIESNPLKWAGDDENPVAHK